MRERSERFNRQVVALNWRIYIDHEVTKDSKLGVLGALSGAGVDKLMAAKRHKSRGATTQRRSGCMVFAAKERKEPRRFRFERLAVLKRVLSFHAVWLCVALCSLAANPSIAGLTWDTTSKTIEVHPLQASETLYFRFSNDGSDAIEIVELDKGSGRLNRHPD